MIGQLRQHLTYANVMSTLAVFLMLTTGTAYATHLVVRGNDVVDGTLTSADLRDGAAVRGADVVNASLRGTDIVESTLAQVPRATIGGLGRSKAGVACDPPISSARQACVVVTLRLPHPARVALTGRITARKQAGVPSDHVATFSCGLATTSGPVEGTEVYGTLLSENRLDLALVGMTPVFPAGLHSFGIDCSDDLGRAEYEYGNLTAVAIAPS